MALGESNECKGLTQREHEDGKTEPVSAAGKTGRRTVKTDRGGRYIYFDTDDSFFSNDTGPLELEVTYLDAGSGPIVLEYDASDGTAPHGGAFKPVNAAALKGTGLWATCKVELADPAFTGRANGSDFRLCAPGGDLTVHGVVARKGRAGGAGRGRR